MHLSSESWYCQICSSVRPLPPTYDQSSRDNLHEHRLICDRCGLSREEAARACRTSQTPSIYACHNCAHYASDSIHHFTTAHPQNRCNSNNDANEKWEDKSEHKSLPACTLCGIVFLATSFLNEVRVFRESSSLPHNCIAVQHSAAVHPKLRCDACSQQFGSAKLLEQHFQESTDHPSCMLCNVGPLDHKRLLEHYISTHTPLSRESRDEGAIHAPVPGKWASSVHSCPISPVAQSMSSFSISPSPQSSLDDSPAPLCLPIPPVRTLAPSREPSSECDANSLTRRSISPIIVAQTASTVGHRSRSGCRSKSPSIIFARRTCCNRSPSCWFRDDQIIHIPPSRELTGSVGTPLPTYCTVPGRRSPPFSTSTNTNSFTSPPAFQRTRGRQPQWGAVEPDCVGLTCAR
ncbi:hypothetical protein BKA93DRAFT_460769 [Sparassis latifolia]